jgi:hypothetical protein
MINSTHHTESLNKLPFPKRLETAIFIIRRGIIPRLATRCIACSTLDWDDEMIAADAFDDTLRLHQKCS